LLKADLCGGTKLKKYSPRLGFAHAAAARRKRVSALWANSADEAADALPALRCAPLPACLSNDMIWRICFGGQPMPF
jgi:hypothetical protein